MGSFPGLLTKVRQSLALEFVPEGWRRWQRLAGVEAFQEENVEPLFRAPFLIPPDEFANIFAGRAVAGLGLLFDIFLEFLRQRDVHGCHRHNRTPLTETVNNCHHSRGATR